MKFLSTAFAVLVPLNSMAHQATSFTEMATVASGLGVDLGWSKGHGCWCPSVYDEFSLKGSPVDPTDKACKEFKECRNCVGKDVDSACTNNEVFDFNWEVGSAATCSSTNDACEMMACQCHINLFNAFASLNTSVTAGTEDLCLTGKTNTDGCCHAGGGIWSMYDSSKQECVNGKLKYKTMCDTEKSSLPAPLKVGRNCAFLVSGLISTRDELNDRDDIDYVSVHEGAGWLSSLNGTSLKVLPEYKVDNFNKKVRTVFTMPRCTIKFYSGSCEPVDFVLPSGNYGGGYGNYGYGNYGSTGEPDGTYDYLNHQEQCYRLPRVNRDDYLTWPGLHSLESYCQGRDQEDFSEAVYYTCNC